MSQRARVASPPEKPIMVFDGECHFCRRWIERWRQITGERVDYYPFQDPVIASKFPELPRARFEEAVQLIEPNGDVYSGAEAVFRSLAINPRKRWLLWAYENVPGFAKVSDPTYAFVARHRMLSSRVTRLLWGDTVTRPEYFLVRSIFLRALGVIYLCAFVSLWTQIIALIGHDGILPAEQTVQLWNQHYDGQGIGFSRHFKEPSFCWWASGDTSLKIHCTAGTLLSLLLLIGIAPVPCLFLLWCLYLSLTTICGTFLGYQWDNLLLEVGFLSIFLAPLSSRLSGKVSLTALWLLRWLLFRLMFASGCVKLLSGDPTWRNFTAMTYHYETQPLPTWVAWYVHQLPPWFQKASTLGMFGVELVVPFLIFLPRRPRMVACALFVALELLIAMTGNYTFFNLLTIALCILLLDDAAVRRFLPNRLKPALQHQHARLGRGWPTSVIAPVAVLILVITSMQLLLMFRVWSFWDMPFRKLYQTVAPFRSINNYGLFAVMTTSRPEIIVEGSADGQNWLAYEFKYKPGDLKERPSFVAPHQPRLDWQMWFAALGNFRQNQWFMAFCRELLEGSPAVLRLLETNPFPEQPPKYIRARLYDYKFTTWPERKASGAWWKREEKGMYCPVLSLKPEEKTGP